ncbi:two-component sensor histidine kinase [Bifidobacterium aemilianum]|uniref:histidine kinase n=1 Tax=Bifidobacterium aemilianum TaxID=2493120 RepID=A0A366KAA8_9BIFI|nr:HAMP domain-containing sensor histidine kinase [Bifidobacterium aemilianum]RBP98666.1 two-component sensor histidine kinase [Bifidobacterium aemilianum]
MPARKHHRAGNRIFRAVGRRLEHFSLSSKLVACTVVLLILGASVISLSIRQFVSNYLLEKTDTQLSQQAELVYRNVDLLKERDTKQATAGPTDYFLQIRDTDDMIVTNALVPVLRYGVTSQPKLPPSGQDGGITPNEPFTTSARVTATPMADKATLQAASAQWRVLARPLADRNNRPSGTVYIGLSLSDQIDTVNTLTRYCIIVSLLIVIIGGFAALVLIQGTLSPLKRIEKTAAKIANGDLSQRVPPAPENTEVGSLAASLNSMLARIESSFKEQEATTEKMKQFVSDASHELRTPLATIHGYTELYAMQRELPGALERADESIEHIKSSSSRMTLLVEDLLSLARLDEGRGIDMSQQVPLTRLLRDAADDLHALDPERQVEEGSLQLRHGADGTLGLAFLPGQVPQISLSGDGSRIRQVMTNIIGNIHRYTPPDSPVEIGMSLLAASIGPDSLSRLPATNASLTTFLEALEVGQSMQVGMNYAVIRFIDHGPGVPEGKQTQIFERFYTADSSRARRKGGTGLGMSIAQSVAKAHHGFIVATSTDGGGLTLTVVLPVEPIVARPGQGPSLPAGGKVKAARSVRAQGQGN